MGVWCDTERLGTVQKTNPSAECCAISHRSGAEVEHGDIQREASVQVQLSELQCGWQGENVEND